jgi:uncharacterized protein YxjI
MVAAARKQTARAEAFFGSDTFYVEKRQSGRPRQCYIFDSAGTLTGQLASPQSLGTHFWRIFLKSALLPFRFEVRDAAGAMIGAIERGWTMFRSRIEIVDAQENIVGFLRHKRNSRKPRIKIFNTEGRKIGEITGARTDGDMEIIDRDYRPIGHITGNVTDSTPGATRGKSTYCISLGGEPGPDQEVILLVALIADRMLPQLG